MCLNCKFWLECDPLTGCIKEEEEGGTALEEYGGFGSVAIIAHDEPMAAVEVRDTLAEAKIPTQVWGSSTAGITSQLSMAATSCASYAVLTNKVLWGQRKVLVKSIATGKYEVVKLSKLVTYLKRHVAQFFSEIQSRGFVLEEEADA